MEISDPASLSRRQWLERLSLPLVAATLGSGLLGSTPLAAEAPASAPDAKDLGSRVYNVRDFGAKGDGLTLDGAAVQAAIDACTRDQGGIGPGACRGLHRRNDRAGRAT